MSSTVPASPASTTGPAEGGTARVGQRLRRALLPDHGGRFATLDGFRAIAAFGVVLYHVAGAAGLVRDGGFVASLLGNLGNFGVAVFFLLSGFLLYRPFVVAHLADRPAPRWRHFYWNRLVRIVPGYWLALTAFLLLVGFKGGERRLDEYVTLYSFTQIYRPRFGIVGLSVAWTLCIEISFYAVLPVLALAIRRGVAGSARTDRTKMQGQLLGLALLVVIAWTYRLVVVPLSTTADDSQHLWLPNYLDWFAFGMVMAVAVTWADRGHALPRLIRVLANTPWVCWVLSAWTYVILALLRGIDPATVVGAAKETTAQVFTRFLFNGVSALFLLLPGIVGSTAHSPIRQALARPVPRYLGTISYGVYLWHKLWLDWLKPEREKPGDTGGFGGVGDAVRRVVGGTRDALQGAIGSAFVPLLVGVVVLTIVTASASWFGWERQFLRLKRGSAAA